MSRPARILFLADTHLGFDDPSRPRVARRRRGDDFLANYGRALGPALRGEVDAVVHGGDVFFRSQIPPRLVRTAFEPLFAIADLGIPVFVVPGNHERSAIPFPLLARHRRVHVFDRPRTFLAELAGVRVAFAGFPFVREAVRRRFRALVAETGSALAAEAQVRLLCLHQAVEGATVGPSDYTFRGGDDVVAAADLPEGFAAVLSGHVHRHQVLTRGPGGRALPAPVLYPGSIERTSFAERGEPKGYLLLELAPSPAPLRVRFCELPARPMHELELGEATDEGAAAARLRGELGGLAADAIVRVRVRGARPPALTDAWLRALAPASMNVGFAEPGGVRARS